MLIGVLSALLPRVSCPNWGLKVRQLKIPADEGYGASGFPAWGNVAFWPGVHYAGCFELLLRATVRTERMIFI